jgi:hypothetical protein
MKKFLLLLSVLLSFATTGLLAQTVTAPEPAPSAPALNATAKKTGKHKHRHHHKGHHQKKPAGA